MGSYQLPYRHDTIQSLDEQVPAGIDKMAESARSQEEPELMTDIRGLTYVAFRNCDLEKFSAK
ncbi:MAG: hypothetical protein WCX63_06830 [Methanoregula sp.]